jgi:hypothetical protein
LFWLLGLLALLATVAAIGVYKFVNVPSPDSLVTNQLATLTLDLVPQTGYRRVRAACRRPARRSEQLFRAHMLRMARMSAAKRRRNTKAN